MIRKIVITLIIGMMCGESLSQILAPLPFPPVEAKKVTVKGPSGRKLRRMIRERKEVAALVRELVESHKFQFDSYYMEDPYTGSSAGGIKIHCYGGRIIIGDINTTAFEIIGFVSKGDEFIEFDILIKVTYRHLRTKRYMDEMLLKCAVNTINGKMGVRVYYEKTLGPTYYGYIKELR